MALRNQEDLKSFLWEIDMKNNSFEKRFTDVLDDDETIIWSDGPEFLPFFASGFTFLAFGLIWGSIDYFFFFSGGDSADTKPIASPSGMLVVLFILLHSSPFWLSVLHQIRLLLVFKNTVFALTDKRVIVRSGFMGIDYRSIDHTSIEDVTVDVGPLESLFKVGTITVDTGKKGSDGEAIYDKIRSVHHPYKVFKKIKKVSLDVKTDMYYPNAFRPSENKGYKTKYTK